MRFLVLLALLSCVCLSQSPSIFNDVNARTNLDNGSGTGWGSCGDPGCSGGLNAASSWSMKQLLSSPSFDGKTAQFTQSGIGFSNVLWWYKLGAHDSFTTFKLDFWLQVDSNTITNGQAFEFDTFQFAQGQRFMFGTQCNYGDQQWDIWNEGAQRWVATGIPCAKFEPGNWYHITWSYHRTGDFYVQYDGLTISQYTSRGSLRQSRAYSLGTKLPSGPMPAGWSDNLGVQFQSDANVKGGTLRFWVDRVSLTAQ